MVTVMIVPGSWRSTQDDDSFDKLEGKYRPLPAGRTRFIRPDSSVVACTTDKTAVYFKFLVKYASIAG